jgi:carbon storage regulator CsrA
MLVLSRRAGEKIVIPNLGIAIEVVRIGGRAVKIGVEAPPSIRVLREELHQQPIAPSLHRGLEPLSRHDLNNRLNHITLGIHLYRRQRDAGMDEQAAATFRILLQDLENVKQLPENEPAAAPAPVAEALRRRTLVVDDHANERELLAGLLNMNGCDCATASDGQEALEYLQHHERPDVVLLDMRMPRCDGPNTLRLIRQESRLADMRVFCVSGTPPQDLGISTGPGGFDGWFPKPLDLCRLLNAIQQNVSPAASN